MPFKSNEIVDELKPRKTPRKVVIRRANLRMILMRGYHTRDELVKRLSVSSATISRDMQVVQEELEEELKKEDMIKLLNDFKLQNQGAYEEAWKLFEKTKHPNAKIGALRLIHDFQNDKIKILQSLGIIREVAPLERKSMIVKFIKPEWMNNGTSATSGSETQLPAVCDTAEIPQEHKEV